MIHLHVVAYMSFVATILITFCNYIRENPFNLKGGGTYGVCFFWEKISKFDGKNFLSLTWAQKNILLALCALNKIMSRQVVAKKSSEIFWLRKNHSPHPLSCSLRHIWTETTQVLARVSGCIMDFVILMFQLTMGTSEYQSPSYSLILGIRMCWIILFIYVANDFVFQ